MISRHTRNLGAALAVTLAAAMLGQGAVRAAPSHALVGGPVAAIGGSDLFGFFQLAQTDSHRCGGGVTQGFRSTGPQFHRLASVQVTTDTHGGIAAMTLVLDRAFIDDRSNGVFAKDLAKSFLREASGPGAAGHLAAEIEAGAGAGMTVVSGRPPPRPPGPPSAAYQVFLGHGPSASVAAEGLVIANEKENGKPVLRISVSHPGGPSCPRATVAN